ncbi:unnamed protein product, partial [Cladocopium goreaui]
DDHVRDELALVSDSVLLQQLVLLDCQRMRGLQVPVIDSLHQLGWLRSQLISVQDRLAILVRQFGIWADDELRFHLHELAMTCAAQGMIDGDFQRPLVIDPLRFSSWFDGRSLSCVQWARSQPDVWVNQTKIIGVFKWDNHWFPVLFIPEGDHVTISLSHRQVQIPARLVNMFVDIATELGFGGIRFHHEMPNFVCHSACGASAIDFLRHGLLGCPLAVTYAQVWGQHAQFREFFRLTLLNETMVSRPWVWASGESDDEVTEREWVSDDEAADSGLRSGAAALGDPLPTVPSSSHTCIELDARIELFAQHAKAMGDDEIRFHLSTLLKQRGARIMVGREILPIVLGFESLNFMNWDEVGHILTEKWPGPTAAESVQQIESRIQASIMAKLPQPMEQDDVPDRLGLLEDQVQQLMQKQVHIDGQVQELSQQQVQSTASLQSQISVQSHQLQGQIESQNQSIQAMFENQLNHIRGLLAKRPREDGE